MKFHRIVIAALAAGIAVGTALAQYGPPGGPPDFSNRDDYDSRDWDDDWDRDFDDDYGRQDEPGYAVGFFYDELSPYGEWIRHPRYGWVWFPRNVSASWRPYSRGRWMETDYGWTWASREPFGWATYHYGRWAWDRRVGWLWVPGTDWGPAWVSWQHGHGYVGWAPLPPVVGFEIGIGIHLGGFNLSVDIAPHHYSFVEERRFLSSSIGNYVLPSARNVTIIRNTTNITNYTVEGERVVNHGVPIRRIEQITGQRAPRLRVATSPTRQGAGVQRNVMRVYRPPATKLETVHVAPRNNAGLPLAAPPSPNRLSPQAPPSAPPGAPSVRPRTTRAPIPVAPRASSAPRSVDEARLAREQKELRASMEREQRALEQIQRQEAARNKAKVNAQEIAQRHAAELQAQKEQRVRAEQQLATRHELQRQAARVSEKAVRAEAPKTAAQRGKPPKGPKAKTDDDDKKGGGQKPARTF